MFAQLPPRPLQVTRKRVWTVSDPSVRPYGVSDAELVDLVKEGLGALRLEPRFDPVDGYTWDSTPSERQRFVLACLSIDVALITWNSHIGMKAYVDARIEVYKRDLYALGYSLKNLIAQPTDDKLAYCQRDAAKFGLLSEIINSEDENSGSIKTEAGRMQQHSSELNSLSPAPNEVSPQTSQSEEASVSAEQKTAFTKNTLADEVLPPASSEESFCESRSSLTSDKRKKSTRADKPKSSGLVSRRKLPIDYEDVFRKLKAGSTKQQCYDDYLLADPTSAHLSRATFYRRLEAYELRTNGEPGC